MPIACTARLAKGREKSLLGGCPWVESRDILPSSEHAIAPPGSLAAVEDHRGKFLGIGYFNPKSAIACRVLTLKNEPVGAEFFKKRLRSALGRRESLFDVPYYRLIHAEADLFPGLLIDRFGGALVIQSGTAGMDLLMPLWMEAVEEILKPETIILRNDIPARKLEGLAEEVRVLRGNVSEPVRVVENGCIYLADLIHGQKTGWFYDQRANRRMIAGLAPGKTLLDVYSHSGGFALPAAKAGADVTLLDSSAFALDLAKRAASLNNVNCEYMQGDAFETMEKLSAQGKKYDIVLADPPAFVKSRKDLGAGLKGYEKVARLAAALVAPGGLLFVASCSHHATRERFNQAVLAGARKAGRAPKILKQTGADADHPIHPQLPQSEYLKGLLLIL